MYELVSSIINVLTVQSYKLQKYPPNYLYNSENIAIFAYTNKISFFSTFHKMPLAEYYSTRQYGNIRCN